jgi:peptidoglycan/LPS O-acetylase OafA/YrhL
MESRRIPELDGIRGLAALTVVAAHYFGEVPHGVSALTVAWLGVDVFFVLSGFLIGSIILEQHDSPNFFRTFYLRRCARIVPVYAAVCVLTLFAAAATAGRAWSDTPFPPGVYTVFGANFIMSATDSAGDAWLRPTWTLDVEEQFYLVLPLLIWMAPRKLLPSLLIALWASATLLRVAFMPSHSMAALVLLPCRMDFLLAGVMLALLRRSVQLSRYMTMLRLSPLVAAVALLLLRAGFGANAFTIFGGTIASLGIAGFLGAILCGAPEASRYGSSALRYFGRISYCLYLVHQPIAGLLHGLLLDSTPDIGSVPAFAVTLLAVAASIGLATASWTWLERPILARAQRYRFADVRLPA